MTSMQIINLWKAGYSKLKMYQLEYEDTLRNPALKYLTKKEKRRIAYQYVDDTLLQAYKSRKI